MGDAGFEGFKGGPHLFAVGLAATFHYFLQALGQQLAYLLLVLMQSGDELLSVVVGLLFFQLQAFDLFLQKLFFVLALISQLCDLCLQIHLNRLLLL